MFDHAVAELQKLAWDKFKAQGLPTTDDENWKYTQLSKYKSLDLLNLGDETHGGSEYAIESVDSPILSSSVLKPYEGFPTLLVFINGFFSETNSRITKEAGLHIDFMSKSNGNTRVQRLMEKFLSRQLKETAFGNLNAAHATDGLVVEIEPFAEIKQPILILNFSHHRDSTMNYRNIISVGEGAKCSFIEVTKGPETVYANNIVTQVDLDAHSTVQFYRVQEEGTKSLHIHNLCVEQKRSSTFEAHLFAVGGALSRHNVDVNFLEEGGSAKLFGLFSANGSQHTDHRLFVDHAVPNCQSEQVYKGILDTDSRGVFNGAIMVREGADQTNARQSNKNLLLSSNAEIDTKPQLEIYADDVKCSHGATVGQLDNEAIFYLRARGIDERLARQILTRAFAIEMIEKIGSDKVKEVFDRVLQNWFNY